MGGITLSIGNSKNYKGILPTLNSYIQKRNATRFKCCTNTLLAFLNSRLFIGRLTNSVLIILSPYWIQ
jgi:hypothetical protein